MLLEALGFEILDQQENGCDSLLTSEQLD